MKKTKKTVGIHGTADDLIDLAFAARENEKYWSEWYPVKNASVRLNDDLSLSLDNLIQAEGL